MMKQNMSDGGECKINNPILAPNRAYLHFALLNGKTHGTGTEVQNPGLDHRKKGQRGETLTFRYAKPRPNLVHSLKGYWLKEIPYNT